MAPSAAQTLSTAAPTTRPPRSVPARHDASLAHRARRALAVVERYRGLEPGVAACALSLRPAADAYLQVATAEGHSPAGASTAFVRRARAAAQLRTRLDVWSALLRRDVPGFLSTSGQPGLRGARALEARAEGVIALLRSHRRARAGLPYGDLAVTDLEGACAELRNAGAATGRCADARRGQLANELRAELDTLASVLVAALGRDHVDARRAMQLATPGTSD